MMDCENLVRDGVSNENFTIWFRLDPFSSHIRWESKMGTAHYCFLQLIYSINSPKSSTLSYLKPLLSHWRSITELSVAVHSNG